VTSVEAGPGGPCDPISFMILDQAPGIEMSDDPTLQARAAAYVVRADSAHSGSYSVAVK